MASAEHGPRSGIIVPQPHCERGVAQVIGASADGAFLIYCNGPNVIVRSIDNPHLAMVYGQHAATVKSAKFAPTGKYVASGDVAGKVRVWAFTHPEHLLKYEMPGLGGEVEDVAWDSESKRIAAVGGGSLKARVFSWDTGSSLAEIAPPMKKNLTVDFKPTRPFRLVMGGEDFYVAAYQGPPFKSEKNIRDHTNFVNCVRYSPDGARFVSVGSDKVGAVYDSLTYDALGRLDPAATHAGSIFACAWSPDSTKLVTAGGDKRLKVWDMAAAGAPAFPCVATIPLGERLDDMQLGVVWPRADTIVSTSLDGSLNFVAAATGAVTARVLGHKESTTLAFAIDQATGCMYTGDLTGRLCVWRPADEARSTFAAQFVSGDVPTKRLAGIAVAGGVLAVTSWDDRLRLGDAASGELRAPIPLPGQPKGVALSAADPHTCVVVVSAAVVVVKGGAPRAPFAVPYGATCVDVSRDGTRVAVGGADKRVHIYTLGGDGVLTAVAETPETGGAVSVVAFSPDGALVAVGDVLREVSLYEAATGAAVVSGRLWMSHTTRVTGLSWAPSGRLLASVSTDRRLCVWSPATKDLKHDFALAHSQPFVGVSWASEEALWTLGSDGIAVRRDVPM